MNTPKIDYSKVKTISVEGTTLNVWYKSGSYRKFEDVDVSLVQQQAIQGHKTLHGLPAPSLDNLVQMLGLTPNQVLNLKGADRLNFWLTGIQVHLQVGRGSRSTKFICPKSATSVELSELFANWGWQQLSQKLYFRPTAGSTVKL